LVVPVLILLVFGIIEFSFVMRDRIAVTSAVRSGARTASAEARAVGYADLITNTPATVTGLVPDAVKAVARNATGIPKTSIQELWVYQSDSNGLPPSGNFTSCSGNCVRYTWDPLRTYVDPTTGQTVVGGFTLASGAWAYTSINACPGDANAQSVGVYLRVRHSFITGLFGTTVNLSDNGVMKFEPIPTDPGPCK